MSLLGTLEIMLDLSQFQNIDLFEQGFYQIRVHFESNGKQTVQPYLLIDTEKQKLLNCGHFQKKPNPDYQALIQDIFFFSKVFQIHYCEQLHEIDDTCLFRVQYDAYPNRFSNIIMKVALLFCDPRELDGRKIMECMKEVSTYSCKVYMASEGLSEYIPILFDDLHSSVCNAYLYTTQIDYKYKPTQNNGQNTVEDFQNFLKLLTSNFQKIPLQNFINNYVDSLREIQHKIKKNILAIQNHIPQDSKPELLKKIVSIPTIQPNRISNFYLQDQNKGQISNDILQLINQVGQSVFQIWFMFVDDIYKSYKTIFNKLQNVDFPKIMQNRLHTFIVKEGIITKDFAQMLDMTKLQLREEQSKKIRELNKNQNYELLRVQDQKIFENHLRIPVFFELILQKHKQEEAKEFPIQTQKSLGTDTGKHLIVFVHGYQGNSLDFRLWKNYFYAKYPHFVYLSSSYNENNTDIDIGDMGLNLAKEVKQFISDRIPYAENFKISLIGHSLGGLIIRAALNHLDQYQKNLYTYVSLATPHIGLGAQQSKLVETGLWFMKKMNKGCQSLNQLTLCDSDKLSSTFIWQLSQHQKLNLFKHVIIVCSHQDQYVPYQSACIMKVKKGYLDGEKCENHNQLTQNLVCNFSNETLLKIDINFALKKATIDSMIGRSAHIEFLDNATFIRIFIDSYYQYFQ